MDSILDDAFLRTLDTMRFMTRTGGRGDSAGVHKSHKSGSSMEFMEYRRYHPGDEIRYVDWHVYGRTNRLFIKLFHAEKDLTLHILVDMSGSMKTCAPGAPAKAEYAKKIAAALAYMGLANHDQVGLTAFSDTIGPFLSPEQGRNVYVSMLNTLSDLTPEGRTDFNGSLKAFAGGGNKPGHAVIISDLLDPAGFKEGLNAMLYSKFSLSLIQVLDPMEINPVLNGSITIQDVETKEDGTFFIDEKAVAKYRKHMAVYLAQIDSFCKKQAIDYHLAHTGLPFEDFFIGYLNTDRERHP